MSYLGIATSVLGLISSVVSSNTNTGSSQKTSSGKDFSASLLEAMNGSNAASSSGSLASFSLPSTMQGLSLNGRNLSLFDPESGYRMMSEINRRNVNYQAQFAELSGMKEGVASLKQAANALGNADATANADTIKANLQSFVGQYNDWVRRFDATTKGEGILNGTQAAEVSLHELRESIRSPFNGAANGIHGLKDLGVTIDPVTKLAALDTTKLDAVLNKNATGAVATIREFSGNFARSAELLNSANNFIPNRLGNLDRAIDYIADNRLSLQREFGLGDTPKTSSAVARALAAYRQLNGNA